MEIGVFHGGSMLLWQDLFPESAIVGVDICNAVHSNVIERLTERATLTFDDAYDKNFVHQLTAAGCSYGLIVDDGPHTLESQCDFLSLYLPLLKTGGVAVIEDIQEISWFEQLEAKIPNGYVSERVDRRSVNGRWDDLMLVVKA
jgi:cephalosporin hydroxylase